MSRLIQQYDQLEIDLDRGLLISTEGDKIRLSPLNLKVLTVLIEEAPSISSRVKLFERVWPNQVVSDDTLNRSISDIRAQLSTVSPDRKYIETIPKRGYRWVAEKYVEESLHQNQETRIPATDVLTTSQNSVSKSKHKKNIYSSAKYLTKNGLIIIGLTALLIGIFSSLIKVIIEPDETSLVILMNSELGSELNVYAINYKANLRDALQNDKYLSILSNTAIQSAKETPYPYFHEDYGVKWVIEIYLSRIGDEIEIRSDIVDARTGLIQASLRELKRWPIRDNSTWRSNSDAVRLTIYSLNDNEIY